MGGFAALGMRVFPKKFAAAEIVYPAVCILRTNALPLQGLSTIRKTVTILCKMNMFFFFFKYMILFLTGR